MSEPTGILGKWWSNAAAATATPFTSAGSFSGARIWRVEHRGELFALRKWPGRMQAKQLRPIHALLTHLVGAGVAIVPAPVATRAGDTIVTNAEHSWELAPWLPGIADYWQDARPTKLAAAMQSLAQIHVAAASFGNGTEQREASAAWLRSIDQELAKSLTTSAALRTRRSRLQDLTPARLDELAAATISHATENEIDLHRAAIHLLRHTAPKAMEFADFWAKAELPLQWRIGDIWHDHVLFTDKRVTGIVDFGAAGFDSPAGDVARLLGSLVGDDLPRWRQGLAAYESVRPLAELEREAIAYFDETGTIISTANWLMWLRPSDPRRSPSLSNRTAGLKRLGRLVERLRILADRGRTRLV